MRRCLFLFSFVLAAGAQTPAMLRGVVRAGGQPAPGVVVTASNESGKFVTTTDDQGAYQFPKAASGAWTVDLRMTGFQPQSRKVEVGAVTEWTLELAPRVAAAPRPRPAGGPGGAGGARQGFQRVAATQTQDQDMQRLIEAEAQAAAVPQVNEANANEALLINGSVSAGLQTGVRDGGLEGQDWENRRGEFAAMGAAARTFGMGGEGGPGFGGPGFGGPGGPGGPGGGPGGPGGPPGGGPGGGPPGGGRGPGGGPGGGFGGGPGFGRGGGPGGGRGGPGGFPGARGPGRGPGGDRKGDRRGPSGRELAFGNRINRGRQGIRGMVFFNASNSIFDARPYSLTGQTVEKASYAQNRFGISAGGPLMIPKLFRSDRTFFFLNYSGNRGRNPYQGIATLPTLAQRGGDFSEPLNQPYQIYDPNGRLPFANNRIPASRFDSISRGLMNFIPLPNQPGAIQNYQYVTSVDNSSDQLSLRLTHSFSRQDRVEAGVNLQWRNANNAQLYQFRDHTDGLGMSWNPGWTHTFGRTLINSLRAGFSRNRSETVPFFAYGADVAGQLGIAGVARDPINYGPPNLSFTNFGGLQDASPILRRDQTTSVNDSITYIRGSHNTSFGAGYRWMQLNNRTDQNARGTFNFSGLATSSLNAQGQPLPQTGFDFADYLLGLPQSSSIRFGAANTYFRGRAFNAYGQDDWRIRSNLTIQAGLRYEYFTPFQEKYDHIANLDISPAFNAVAVVLPGQAGPFTGAFPRGLVDSDPNNVSPRVGIAYRPWGKRSMNIRAGYGVFFNGGVYNGFPTRMAAQPPFANTASVNTSLARTLTLANGFATAPSQSITNTYALDRDYRVGYAQTWNFSLQQNLTRQLVVELGYLGTKGTRLDLQRMPNRAAPGSPLTAEQRRQIGNAVGFVWDTSDANSIYHAAQFRISRRFSRGMSYNFQYTYGKSLDNASSLGGGGGGNVAQNDKDLRAERGRSSFDQRHVINVFYMFNSPVRDSNSIFGSSVWGKRLAKDWNLSGGLSATSGSPMTARVLGAQADASGTGATGAGRADATGLPLYDGGRFFNLLAFAIPPSGRYGNSARNVIDGPARVSLNLSLGRSFQVADRKNLEFRADSQNFTNRVNYTSVGTVVNAINYGLPTDTSRMRTVSLSIRFRF